MHDGQPAGDEPACAACVYWTETTERGDTVRNGQCRRYPPAILHDSDDGPYCLQPMLESDEWCGEFRRVLM
jgi:hypothetical protein